ncbi:hypothetical protein KIPB_003018, partial [Kipferlia bialata]|eukprot:g3018.t1
MSGTPQDTASHAFERPIIPLSQVRVEAPRQSHTKGLSSANGFDMLLDASLALAMRAAMRSPSLGLNIGSGSQYPVYVDATGKVLPCKEGARLSTEGERETDTSKASLVYILREMAYQRLHALGVPISFRSGVGVLREGKGGSSGVSAAPVPVTDPLFIDALLLLEGVTRVTCPDMERRKRLFKTLCTDRHF